MIDLSHWYLTLPEGTPSTVATEYLVNFYQSQYFTNDGSKIVFWAPVSGSTTKNSDYPRSELRETKTNGDLFNWDYTAYAHNHLHAEMAVNQIPSTKKIVIGQIHGESTHPMLKLYYYDGAIRALWRKKYNGDDAEVVLAQGVPLNAKFQYDIDVSKSGVLTLSATVNGKTQTWAGQLDNASYKSDTQYFKAGVYVQDNEGSGSEGGRTTFYDLKIVHGAYSDNDDSDASSGSDTGGSTGSTDASSGSGTSDTVSGGSSTGGSSSDASSSSGSSSSDTAETPASSGSTSDAESPSDTGNAAPASVIDLKNWSLNVADAAGSTIGTKALSSYSSAYFKPSASTVDFWAPVSGGRAGGSSYAATELRESNADGSARNWRFGAYDTTLDAAAVINQVPSSGTIVVGQVQNKTSNAPVVTLEYQASSKTLYAKVRQTPTGSLQSVALVQNLKIGDRFGYYFHLTKAGSLSMIGKLNGKNTTWSTKLDPKTWANQDLYFKAGVYVKDKDGAASEGGAVSFSKLVPAHK
jgi:hypothetical protein